MRNIRPSGPLCMNCLATQILCECLRDGMEGRACCGQCEHAGIRSEPEAERP